MTAFDDLLTVQELDTAIDQLSHRIDALPERDRQAKAQAGDDGLPEMRLPDHPGGRRVPNLRRKRQL